MADKAPKSDYISTILCTIPKYFGRKKKLYEFQTYKEKKIQNTVAKKTTPEPDYYGCKSGFTIVNCQQQIARTEERSKHNFFFFHEELIKF